jgi:ribonuclease III
VTNTKTLTMHLGYTFTSSAYLTQALTHRSAHAAHNERLEYLGDAVLDCVIAEALYTRYPTLSEGKLTRMRASLVKGETLAELATKIELGDALILGQGERNNQGRTRTSTLADALEAIFGAVFLDGGFEASKQVILRIYQAHLGQLTPETSIKDAKTELQEYAQAKKLPMPRYSIIKTEGDVHEQHFYVACHINTHHAAGEGSTRRKAEQLAAAELLEQLKN